MHGWVGRCGWEPGRRGMHETHRMYWSAVSRRGVTLASVMGRDLPGCSVLGKASRGTPPGAWSRLPQKQAELAERTSSNSAERQHVYLCRSFPHGIHPCTSTALQEDTIHAFLLDLLAFALAFVRRTSKECAGRKKKPDRRDGSYGRTRKRRALRERKVVWCRHEFEARKLRATGAGAADRECVSRRRQSTLPSHPRTPVSRDGGLGHF